MRRANRSVFRRRSSRAIRATRVDDGGGSFAEDVIVHDGRTKGNNLKRSFRLGLDAAVSVNIRFDTERTFARKGTHERTNRRRWTRRRPAYGVYT